MKKETTIRLENFNNLDISEKINCLENSISIMQKMIKAYSAEDNHFDNKKEYIENLHKELQTYQSRLMDLLKNKQ